MSELVTIRATALTLGVKAAGQVLATAGRVLYEGLRTILSPGAQAAFRELIREVPEQTQTVPAPARSAALMPRSVRALGLSPQEARSLTELASVAALPVDDPKRLRNDLQSAPVERWPEIVRAVHARVFVQSLTEAATRACRGIGFDRVKVSGTRLQAEDGSGRALVVEVEPDGSLRAEVLGTADPSCHRVIDDFLRALRNQGVAFADPNRRPTGGIPVTESGRTWVRHRYTGIKGISPSGNRQTRPASAPKAHVRR